MLYNTPTAIFSGTETEFEFSDSDYPVATYAVTYRLRNLTAGDAKDYTAAESGTSTYTITIPTSDTLTAGDYNWQLEADDGVEKFVLASGIVPITASLHEATTSDPRTHAKKVLDAIEATIEGKASEDQLRYRVGGMEIEKMEWPDLIKAQQYYSDKYRRELDQIEQNPTGIKIKNQNKFYTRFV